jgi:hypothetical protein
MFTLVYINGNFNRPETLSAFLQSNVGKTVMLQVDCVTPYKGTEQELVTAVCGHLNEIDSQIEVKYEGIQNISMENLMSKKQVHFIVMQVQVNSRI